MSCLTGYQGHNPILFLLLITVSMTLSACKENSPISGPSAGGTGSLLVSSIPNGATVTLDNVATGRATPTTFEGVAVGQHAVKLTLSGYADTTVTAVVGQSEATSASVALRSAITHSDSVFLRIKLSHLPSTLTFNQNHVPTNYAEYWWGILFNTDGNASTGLQGYDIEIALVHPKQAGSPFQASPIEGTQHQVIEWIDSAGSVRGYVRHNSVAARIDPADANTLVVAVPRSWAEIALIDALDEFYIHTIYFAPSPPHGSDRTSVAVGTQPIADPGGDTNYDFIDIVLGGWNTQLLMNPLMENRPELAVRTGGESGGDSRIRATLQWSGGTWVH